MKVLLLVAIALSNFLVVAQTSPKWQKLVDGQTLKGWHIIPGGQWTAKEGAIMGKNDKSDARHGLLVSDKTYKNFVVRMKYKAIKGNSGFYFRVQQTGDIVGVKGFQAEIDPDKDAGGLYETSGRGWVVQPSPTEIKTWYKPNEWNEMSITALDGTITVTVNGKVSAQVTNDPGLREGHFALQLHGGQDVEVLFRDIQIPEK